jgi:hypothetical protein
VLRSDRVIVVFAMWVLSLLPAWNVFAPTPYMVSRRDMAVPTAAAALLFGQCASSCLVPRCGSTLVWSSRAVAMYIAGVHFLVAEFREGHSSGHNQPHAPVKCNQRSFCELYDAYLLRQLFVYHLVSTVLATKAATTPAAGVTQQLRHVLAVAVVLVRVASSMDAHLVPAMCV